jgi:hypothetical protein
MAVNNAINNTSSLFSTSTTLQSGTSTTITSGDLVITAGNIVLPFTTSTPTGCLNIAGQRWMHAYGNSIGSANTFVGYQSGNFTLTTASAVRDVCVGYLTGSNLAAGYDHIFMMTNVSNHQANGYKNILIGWQTGWQAGTGSSSHDNVCVGPQAHIPLTTGVTTTSVGYYNARNNSNMNYGVLMGRECGSNQQPNHIVHIYYGTSDGVADYNDHHLYLGLQGTYTKTYIAGIENNTTPTSGAHVVLVNSSGNMLEMGAGTGYVANWGSRSQFANNIPLPGHLIAGSYITATAGDITATAGNVNIGSTSNDDVCKTLTFKKKRTGVITTGDNLGSMLFQGYDGSSYLTTSQINSKSGGTIASNRIASNLTFYTHKDAAIASILRMTIASTGGVEIAAPDSGVGLKIDDGGMKVQAGNTTLVTTYGATVGVTNAALYIDNTGLLGQVASSRNLKENIDDIEADITSLRPVTFTYKQDSDHKRSYGLIAEEVLKLIPELVLMDTDDITPYSVRYDQLSVLILHEMKKVSARIQTLLGRIKFLEIRGV